MILKFIYSLFKPKDKRDDDKSRFEKEKEFYRGLNENAVRLGHYGSSRLKTLDAEEGFEHIRYM